MDFICLARLQLRLIKNLSTDVKTQVHTILGLNTLVYRLPVEFNKHPQLPQNNKYLVVIMQYSTLNASTAIDTSIPSSPSCAHHSPDPRTDTPTAADVNAEQVRHGL
jgi:hypothetical protein